MILGISHIWISKFVCMHNKKKCLLKLCVYLSEHQLRHTAKRSVCNLRFP